MTCQGFLLPKNPLMFLWNLELNIKHSAGALSKVLRAVMKFSRVFEIFAFHMSYCCQNVPILPLLQFSKGKAPEQMVSIRRLKWFMLYLSHV